MSKHTLALEAIETACESVLKIADSSIYVDGMPFDCSLLEVTVPGFTQPVYFYDVLQGFNKTLTGVDLEIQATNPETPCVLPDGIYTLTYSVAPNDKLRISYYHMRTTRIVNDYYNELCKLELSSCEPTAEVKQNVDDLRYIKMLIDAAKAKVEYCHSNAQGTEMYNYAAQLLSRYKTGCCITCNCS